MDPRTSPRFKGDAFEQYKPVRNHLRKVALIESLGVIRSYVQHMQFGSDFPSDIEVAPYFLQARTPLERKVFEWEIDVLAREVILNASELKGAPETLRRWSYFSNAVNKLKTFADDLTSLYPKGSIMLEIHRIAHRQFIWQQRPNAVWTARYFRIFSDPAIDEIIRHTIGIGTKDLYGLGMALLGLYHDRFALNYPPTIEIPGLDLSKLDLLLQHFATTMADLKLRTAEVQEINENHAYVFNPLRIHPLVWVDLDGQRSVIAPIPTFLWWRFTEGVYYEIYNAPGFSDAFGRSYQAYVGHSIARANESRRLKVYPEAEYYVGKDRRDSIDWIIEDATAMLFVESKTKRLRLDAKTELRSREALESEIDKLAAFLVQVYKTIRDFRENRYPHRKYDPAKAVFPLVVTLGEWFAFGDMIQQEIERRVVEKLEQEGLPREWVDDMPYATCSIQEFERLVQVLHTEGIAEVMRRRASNSEYKKWQLGAVINQEFKSAVATVRPLFPEVMDELARWP